MAPIAGIMARIPLLIWVGGGSRAMRWDFRVVHGVSNSGV